MKWLQQQVGWIGITLAILIAIFPQSFARMGTIVKMVVINYWLQISLLMIIVLLVLVFLILLKQQKSDSS